MISAGKIIDVNPVVDSTGNVVYQEMPQLNLGIVVETALAVVGAVSSVVKTIKAGVAKRKALLQQADQIEQAIVQISEENAKLQEQIDLLRTEIRKFKVIPISINGLKGFGKICIINCKLKAAAADVNDATARYDALEVKQNELLAYIQKLSAQLEQLQAQQQATQAQNAQAKIDLTQKAQLKNILIAGGIALAAGTVIYMVTK